MLILDIEVMNNKDFLKYLFEKSQWVSFKTSITSDQGVWPCSDMKTLFEKMQDFKAGEYEDTEYFCSSYCGINRVEVYRVNQLLLNYMLDHRNSEVWAAYGLPEDPCFMDKEGLCLLRTVVHEEICEYYGEVLENADFFEEARQDDFHRPKLDFEGSRERVALKKAEIEREQQAQENTVQEIAPALRNAGFCISENHFFRIAENQIFIFGMVQGEEIHYDAIPMFGDYSNRLRIFPDFSTVLHKEEKELYDTSDKNLFLEFILPKLAAVNDLESLYVLRADFCQSHFGETIEDDTLAPYILMKLGRYQEAAAQIRTLYESHMSAILDFESRAAAFLDEEEYDETKNWLQKEFSCLLSLANYAESGDYAAVNRLLEETQEKTLEHIRRDIAEIPFRA